LTKRRYRLLVFAAVALAVLLGGWFASEVFEGETMAFDSAVREYIHSQASPALTQVMIGLSIIGSPLVVVLIAVIALAVFLYKGLRRDALLLAVSSAAELILNTTLKLFYLRVRPEAYFDYPLPASFSFPSGHAAGSFCIYGMLGILIATHLTSRPARWVVRLAAALLVLLIGTSRVYLGVHYPTDVLAGYFLGAIIVTLAVSIPRRYS
jgi:undecaprenyl-diphosphatase